MKDQGREKNYQLAYAEIEKKANKPITNRFIEMIHDLVVGPKGQHGYRTGSVRIFMGKNVYIPPNGISVSIENEVRKLCDWFTLNKSIKLDYECAAKLHWGIVKIHPFEDGNGRTARLILIHALRMYGYDDFICRNLELYFETNKGEYGNVLDDGKFSYMGFDTVSERWVNYIKDAIIECQNLKKDTFS